MPMSTVASESICTLYHSLPYLFRHSMGHTPPSWTLSGWLQSRYSKRHCTGALWPHTLTCTQA